MNHQTIQTLVDVAVNFGVHATEQLALRCPGSEIDEDRLFEGGLHVVSSSIPDTAAKSISEAILVQSALHTELHRRTGTYGSDEFWNAWSGLTKGTATKNDIEVLCSAVMKSVEFQEEFASVLNDAIAKGRLQTADIFIGAPD